MSEVKKAEDILNNFFTYMYKWYIYIIGSHFLLWSFFIFTPIFIAIWNNFWINSV